MVAGVGIVALCIRLTALAEDLCCTGVRRCGYEMAVAAVVGYCLFAAVGNVAAGAVDSVHMLLA